jgi:hypothetical protein
MLILNADISHNLKDWLMWLTIKSEDIKKRTKLKEEMLVQFNLEHHSVIGL